MRIRNKKWVDGELAENPLILNRETQKRGDEAPLFSVIKREMELGCGKGRFIAETAAQNPGASFIAVERESKIIASAARLARERELNNIRFLCADAAELPEMFAPNSFDVIYINFCDPWDRKKKWIKRRLTHRNFLEIYRKLLKPDGKVALKTDNRALFDFSLKEFEDNGWTASMVTYDLHAEEYAPSLIMTEYEMKFVSMGTRINRLEARPQAMPSS